MHVFGRHYTLLPDSSSWLTLLRCSSSSAASSLDRQWPISMRSNSLSMPHCRQQQCLIDGSSHASRWRQQCPTIGSGVASLQAAAMPHIPSGEELNGVGLTHGRQ